MPSRNPRPPKESETQKNQKGDQKYFGVCNISVKNFPKVGALVVRFFGGAGVSGKALFLVIPCGPGAFFARVWHSESFGILHGNSFCARDFGSGAGGCPLVAAPAKPGLQRLGDLLQLGVGSQNVPLLPQKNIQYLKNSDFCATIRRVLAHASYRA